MLAFKTALKTSVAVVSACLAIAACSSDETTPNDHDHGDHDDPDHDHSDLLPFCDLPLSCREIVAACHTKDDVSNTEIHECHETGHEVGTDAACSAVHDDCIEKCNAAPELGPSGGEELESCEDGGSTDVDHDHDATDAG